MGAVCRKGPHNVDNYWYFFVPSMYKYVRCFIICTRFILRVTHTYVRDVRDICIISYLPDPGKLTNSEFVSSETEFPKTLSPNPLSPFYRFLLWAKVSLGASPDHFLSAGNGFPPILKFVYNCKGLTNNVF